MGKRVFHLAAAAFLSFLATTAPVGATGPGSITALVDKIRVDQNGHGLVQFAGTMSDFPSCCQSPHPCFGNAFAFDTNTAAGKGILALVTAAKLSTKHINALGTGSCTLYGEWAEDWLLGTLLD